jgi:hypothetical protein
MQQRVRAKLLGNFAWTLMLLAIAVAILLYRLLFNGVVLGG